MNCLAVIPARGGSKGLPRKNVLPLAGAPLVAHSIVQALAAECVTRVVVSTDDAEIAQVARAYGAEVVIRPAELASDTASSESAVFHVLDELAARDGYVPELVMLMQCTSPLTLAVDIDGAVCELLARDADSCFTASAFHHFLWGRDDSGRAVGINHEGQRRKRRQDLEPQYLENGAVYVMRTEAFRGAGDRFAGKVVMHVVPASRCLEIDDATEFAVAETLLQRRRREEGRAKLPERVRALVLDFDGVLTSNRVWVTEQGIESVDCDRGDGLGLGLLRERGVEVLILSKERNPVVTRRGEKLRIPVLQGIDDKPTALREWLEARAISLAETVYVGNDVNDIGCMSIVGFAACPSDAHESVRPYAALVLEREGGRGAVRELCDVLLESGA